MDSWRLGQLVRRPVLQERAADELPHHRRRSGGGGLLKQRDGVEPRGPGWPRIAQSGRNIVYFGGQSYTSDRLAERITTVPFRSSHAHGLPVYRLRTSGRHP